ncbi:MAG: DUF3048 domain-containing protein, partial [Anaerolineae bacterium]
MWYWRLLVLVTLVLVGCQQGADPVAGLPTKMSSPVSSLLPATQMATPSVTPLPPSATPTLLPTLTATPIRTLTPTLTATATATPTPTLTPTPVSLLTAADFGDARSPFTGELAAEPANLQRRPLAIKISNSPAQWVRPQSGLSQADLVFEHYAEGATRFTAIFHSQTPPKLGPVRSARLIDLELPIMYDAALGFSGAHEYTRLLLEDSELKPRLIRNFEEGYYRTGEDKPWEHTFYAIPETLWQTLANKGQNRPPNPSNVMPFAEQTPPGGETAVSVEVGYWRTVVNWEYDDENGRYLRWADGEPHTDANNGEQISAANVVVLYAPHVFIEDVCVYAKEGVCEVYPMEIQLWDEGAAVLFRDGSAYPARWQRWGIHDMLTLVDDAGNPLPFQIGPTWFQILPSYRILRSRLT